MELPELEAMTRVMLSPTLITNAASIAFLTYFGT